MEQYNDELLDRPVDLDDDFDDEPCLDLMDYLK